MGGVGADRHVLVARGITKVLLGVLRHPEGVRRWRVGSGDVEGSG